MDVDPEIKPALTAIIGRVIDITLNDSDMREKIAGLPPVDYTQMLENEKLARPFIKMADLILKNNKEEIADFIKKLDRPTVKTINVLLYCAFLIYHGTYLPLAEQRRICEFALKNNEGSEYESGYRTEIERTNKIIKRIIELCMTRNVAYMNSYQIRKFLNEN